MGGGTLGTWGTLSSAVPPISTRPRTARRLARKLFDWMRAEEARAAKLVAALNEKDMTEQDDGFLAA